MHRVYRDQDVVALARGIDDGALPTRIEIQHESGSALISPDCELERAPPIMRGSILGFDGTKYALEFDEDAQTLSISSSAPSAILGGEQQRLLNREEDIATQSGEVRHTGLESTMPITVKE